MDGKVVVGLMSGTSMDGIDVCIVKIVENQLSHLNFRVLNHSTYEYPPGMKEDLLRISSEGGVKEVSQYNVLLGRLFGEAVLRALEENSIYPQQVALVGSHGQTIYHQPTPKLLHSHEVASTLQIGDPSTIAVTCGITTVGDFRLADMACGGQGAPLVPYLDQLLAKQHSAKTGRIAVFLNVGGISNIFTVNQSDGKSIGFDVGPGNVLIDGLMKLLFDEEYDDCGQVGSRGSVDQELLQCLIDEDLFVLKDPPKSTGREYYNRDYINSILKKSERFGTKKADIISTVTAFTAHAVSCNYRRFIEPLLTGYNETNIDLLISGGGAKNEFLLKCLQEQFQNMTVNTTELIGIPADCKEALCFAILGYQTFNHIPTNLPSVTGAHKHVVLGKICQV